MKKGLLIVIGMLFSIQNFAQESYSLSLDEAIAFALENNYNILKANDDIKLSEYKNRETVAIGLPQIDAKVDYQNWLKQQISLIPAEIAGGEQGEFIEVAFGTQNNLGATATLNQLLFDGSYVVGLKYLQTYLQISLNAKEKTEQIVREAVINAYGNVLFTEEGISILEKNIETLEKNLKETKAYYLNGFAEEESVEQLEITLSSLKSSLSRTIKLKDISYKMLNIVLGTDINNTVTLTENLDQLTAKNICLDLLSEDFNVENHIDYKIATITQEGKEAVVKLEKSKALPTLNAFVNYGYTGYSETFSFLDSNQQWFDSSLLGVSLNVPIFSSLARSSRTQQAKIDYDKATINVQETSQRVYLELEKAKVEYKYTIEEYETSKQNLALAERIEKKQEIKFFEGLSTSFDLLNAQQQLYTLQQNYLQAMLNVIDKKAALDKALNKPINN
jgi:outer membrane protein TolC